MKKKILKQWIRWLSCFELNVLTFGNFELNFFDIFENSSFSICLYCSRDIFSFSEDFKKLFGLKSIRKKITFSASHWKWNQVDWTKLRERHRRNRCVTVTSHCVTWISGRYNKVQHLKKPSPIQTFSWKWYLKLHRLYFYNTGQRFHGANLSLLGKKLKTGFGWDGFDWFLNGGHATFARTTSVLNN